MFDFGIKRTDMYSNGHQRVTFRCGCEWVGNWSDNELLRDIRSVQPVKCKDEPEFHEWLANDLEMKHPRLRARNFDLGIAFVRRVGVTAHYVRFHCGCAGVLMNDSLPYDGWFFSPYCVRSEHAKTGRCYATYDPKRDWLQRRREYEERTFREEAKKDDE